MLNREAVNAIRLARKMMQEGGEASVEDVADPYEERASDQIEYMPEAARIAYEPSVTPTSAIDYTLGSSGVFTPPPSAPDPFEERATQAIDYVRPAPDPYEQRATQAIDYVQPAPDPYEERTKESLADRALRVISTQPQPTRAPAPAASRSSAPAPAPAKQGFLDRIFSGPQYQSTGQQVVQNGQVNWGDAQNAADFFRADKAMQEALKKASAAAPARSPEPRTQAAGYARPAPEQRSAALAAIGRQVPGEGEMRRPFFDVPFLAGDLSKASTYARASEPLAAVNGIVFHHTAGRGKPEDIINVLNQRGLGVQFVMDRDGSIYQALPNGARGAHMRPSQVVPLDNSNAIGVEMIARDNDDVTPEQVAAARQLFDTLRKQYPNIQPWGHGEVNPHKMSTEGMAAVSAIRSAYDIQPTFQNVRRAAPPMGARTLRGYQTGDYAEGGRVPLLSDQYPTSYLPNVGRQVMQDGGVPNETVALAQQVMSADPMGSVTMAGAPASEGTSIIETTPPVDQTVERAEQVMREYTPTTREKIKAAIAGYDVGKPSPERARFAEGIAAMIPGIALEDAARRAQAGQPGQAALEALNALPVVALPARQAVKTATDLARVETMLPPGVSSAPLSNLRPQARINLAEMYQEANLLKPDFDNFGQQVANTVGGRWQDAPLKGTPRATAKIADDYAGDPSQIKDILRGTVDISHPDDAAKVIEMIGQKYPVQEKGFRNLFDPSIKPIDGYRDAKLNVNVNGHIAEIQVNMPEMLAAKKQAHDFYEEREAIKRAVARRGDSLPTDAERAQIDYLNQKMREIYEPAFERARARVSATSDKNLSSLIGDPLRVAESTGKRRGGSLSQAAQYGTLPPAPNVTGTPSTSRNSALLSNFIGDQVRSKKGRPDDTTLAQKQKGGAVESALKLSSQFGPGAAQEAVRSLKQRPGRR